MAQTINDIEQEIITEKEAQADLDVLTSTSKVSIWRLIVYTCATAIWSLVKKQDAHKEDVQNIVDTQTIQRLSFYEDLAKAYQHGRALIPESDQYDNTGLTEEEIEDEKVVKYARAVEVYDTNENLKGIRIKMATLTGGELAKLSDAHMAGFEPYILIVKGAGIKIYPSTGDPDDLKADLKIYYDPLVLKADGSRIDGTDDTPLQTAIDDFLKNDLDFNGLFVVASFVDKLQKVDGIVIPHVNNIQARYGALDFEDVEVEYLPDAGYMVMDYDNDLTVEWIAHAPI